MSMSDDEIRGLMAGPFPRTKPTAGFIAFARAVERAARAAAFDDAIAACGAEAAGFRENRLWEAVAGIQACIDALRARAEGDGEGGR